MSDVLTSLRAANAVRQKEWDRGDVITLEYRGNEMAGEVGEACNVIKKLARERLGIRGARETVEHLAEELADVVICADLVAMQAGIDLDAAVVAKFNATSEKNGLATRLLRSRSDARDNVTDGADGSGGSSLGAGSTPAAVQPFPEEQLFKEKVADAFREGLEAAAVWLWAHQMRIAATCIRALPVPVPADTTAAPAPAQEEE